MNSNQFTSDPDRRLSLFEDYMARGSQAQMIRDTVKHLSTVPNLCLLPTGPSVLFMRVAGKLHKLSVKGLVYYAATGLAPTFGPCTCNNPGCINPAHQNVVSK